MLNGIWNGAIMVLHDSRSRSVSSNSNSIFKLFTPRKRNEEREKLFAQVYINAKGIHWNILEWSSKEDFRCLDKLKKSYSIPFFVRRHIETGQAYGLLHPRRGRSIWNDSIRKWFIKEWFSQNFPPIFLDCKWRFGRLDGIKWKDQDLRVRH